GRSGTASAVRGRRAGGTAAGARSGGRGGGRRAWPRGGASRDSVRGSSEGPSPVHCRRPVSASGNFLKVYARPRPPTSGPPGRYTRAVPFLRGVRPMRPLFAALVVVGLAAPLSAAPDRAKPPADDAMEI